MPANDLSEDRSETDRRTREHDLLRELDEVNARPRPPVDPDPGLIAPGDGAPGREDPPGPFLP
jgi:hypothetical protein